MRHIFGVLLVLICYCQTEVRCQSRSPVIVRKFTQKDGLSSYNVRKIIEDRWGFIWVATQDGISRFDGRTFINYSKNSLPPHKISGSEVREVIEDSTHHLVWALSAEGGVDAISTITGKVERTIKCGNFSKEDYNLSMLKVDNEIWVGSSTGVQVLNIRKKTFESDVSIPDGHDRGIDFSARSIQQDEYKNIWICYGGYGIVVYHYVTKVILKTITLSELGQGKRNNEIRIPKGVFLKKGEVLFASSQGLRKIRYDKDYHVRLDLSPSDALPVLNSKNIDWITVESENSLLISGHGNIYRSNYSLSRYEVVAEVSRTYESNWLSSVLCIYKDDVGNTWLGCQEGLGFIDKNGTPFSPYGYDLGSNVKLDHVFAVSPVGDEDILVGLRKGLVKINKRDGRYVQCDRDHWYRHIFIDLNGVTHIYRSDGLFIYRKGRIVPIHVVFPEFFPYSDYLVNSHLLVNDTLTILGTENNRGILVWNPKKKWVKNFDIRSSPALASSIVNNIFMDELGRIWVLSDYVITILSADLSSRQEIELKGPSTGTPYGLFFDMCEVNGSYFIASYSSGVLELDKYLRVRRVFNTQNGLSNDGVYQIYPLLNNELLVTSNNGLSRISLNTSKISRYYKNDGLHSNAFEEVSGLAADGKIYAGGVNGFTVIDPAAFYTNLASPRIYFTGVEMKTAGGKDESNDVLMKVLTISNEVLQTTIRFVGINYSNPERTSYAYRIVEESKDWIENGNQASLTLIGHAPGYYRLEVKASNEEGIFSKPIELQLYFQPKWYQTWWFRIITLILFIGLVYLYFRFRIKQFKIETEIRRRLASDLHDDLGSTINSINIYTNLAIMEYGENRYLANIKEGAQESISSIRDIVWILDDNKDSISHLVERIQHFASPLCEVKGINFSISIGDNFKEYGLEKGEKRNLYLICKEAINNSIKYADPQRIDVSVSGVHKNPIFVISDDGIGFDNKQKNRGNGLVNMQRRAQEIGYRFDIYSTNANGTQIDLSKKH